MRLKGFSLKGSNHHVDAILAEHLLEKEWVKERLFDYRLPITVIGPRQAGKSTLLKQLVREYREKRVPAAYVTLEGLSSHKDISELTQRTWPTISEQVVSQIEGLDDHLVLEDTTSNSLFKRLHQIRERTSSNPIIFFDEFSYVALHQEWLSELRGYNESCSHPIRMVLADRSHPVQYPAGGLSPFNITNVVYLQDFSDPLFSKFLSECSNANGVKILQEHASKLYAMTKGQPYLMQVAGSRLVSEILSNGKTTSSDQDIKKIIGSMMEDAETTSLEIYHTFTDYLTRGEDHNVQLGNAEKRILKRVLNSERVSFDNNGSTGNLFILGFVVPTVYTSSWDEWRLQGDTHIRNPLYERFLDVHRELLG